MSEATQERESQRSESEARDILHELDRLKTLPENRKTRWVWELLQNAKDVADSSGVDIEFKLTPNELVFSHNGFPFETKHLLAILYKTSTKSLEGKNGSTGKYGTGFVTTHILNRKLTIQGVHKNASGKRNFELKINRCVSSTDEDEALIEMQKILRDTFSDIEKIADKAPEEVSENQHLFSYPLTPTSYLYAEKGLFELERNIAFTLLINQEEHKRINSITIEKENNDRKQYFFDPRPTFVDGVQFISPNNNEYGVLFHTSGKLAIGIPAKNINKSYVLLPIEKQAVIFKEFPLIGTENFNLPVFVQHKNFQPTELRDGIRTKKEVEDENDSIADRNREALIEFLDAYLIFIEKLIKAELKNIHLVAKSGLPEFVEDFSNIEWYRKNIQTPLRNFILRQEIVETCSGNLVRINQAKFLKSKSAKEELFYSLASKLLPNQIPDEHSVWEWSEIVAQEPELWPEGLIIDDESLLAIIPESIDVPNAASIELLKMIYKYLEENNLNTFGEQKHIFLNEANEFCLRDDVAIHPVIDDEFKAVSKGLGRDLDKEFLNKKLGHIPAIREFELFEFYNSINRLISEQKVESATEEQTKAIFNICCLFRSERAYRRESWFDIIHQILPGLAPRKKYISVDYENFARSAELWSIKYICSLIESCKTTIDFAHCYFQGNEEASFDWINDFLKYIFTIQDDTKEVILKRHIIPTQAGAFQPYDDSIYAEKNSAFFDDIIKDIHREYTDKGDPRRYIVDRRIVCDGIRTKEVDSLTIEINKLFQDPNIESKVKKGGEYNEMFLQLHHWYEEHGPSAANFLPTFAEKQASLYVLALGEGFSKRIMEIQRFGKSMDDIVELAKIKLNLQELKFLDNAVSELGESAVLEKMQEMLTAKKQRSRWKEIGRAAEAAFKAAMNALNFSWDVGNPDIGKDFEVIFRARNYSIEIKSVAAGKEHVRMSMLQGKTAVSEHKHYALCVMTRPEHDSIPIDKDYFINNSAFVTNIGEQIGNKINDWNTGLRDLESDEDIKVILENKSESVYVSRYIWRSGISFDAFFKELEKYFTDEIN